MDVSASEYITVGVSDMERSLGLFRDLMQLEVERDYRASPSLKAAWNLSAETEAHVVELSCKGYPMGRLRLVAYSPTPKEKVRIHSGPGPHDGAADVGCKAIDFYVADPIQPIYEAIKAAGYETRSAPILHELGEVVSEEFIFWGPDGVPLLLMVGHVHPDNQLRPGSPDGPFSEIATVSIVGESLKGTRAFYEGALGMVPVVEGETPEAFVDKVNELTGTPRGTAIRWLVYAAPGEASGKILVIHFIGASTRRLTGRMRPGRLGFSLLTHRTSDIRALEARLDAGGYRIQTRPRAVDVAGETCQIMLAVGPNEEMFEFVERSPA
tara:strand:- start:1154 stop:2128 length:975 start_codon:yes stop_codon:yes gene_type:complete